MAINAAAASSTKCPLCAIAGDVGELKNAGGHCWVCQTCGHEFKGLDAVLRALNVARSKKRTLEEEQKRSTGRKTVKVWKELRPKFEPVDQVVFEFAELKCFHCGVIRDKTNYSIFIHRANRSVGWLSMDGRYFCPKCYMKHKYELYA